MKRFIMFILVASILAFMPIVASADQVEGSVQGFTCVTQGTTCPVGMEDPMAAAERVFVVLTKDNTYFFVPNVDRAVLARHINERVKVSGKLSTKFNSIEANKIERYSMGTWKTTWTMKDQLEMIDKLGTVN
jgi:hypothetical protein